MQTGCYYYDDFEFVSRGNIDLTRVKLGAPSILRYAAVLFDGQIKFVWMWVIRLLYADWDDRCCLFFLARLLPFGRCEALQENSSTLQTCFRCLVITMASVQCRKKTFVCSLLEQWPIKIYCVRYVCL